MRAMERYKENRRRFRLRRFDDGLWQHDFPAVFGFDERDVGVLRFVAGFAFQRAFNRRLGFVFIGVGDFAEGYCGINGFHFCLFGFDDFNKRFLGIFRFGALGFHFFRHVNVLGGFGGIAVDKFGKEGLGNGFRALFGALGKAADSGKRREEEGFEEGFHGLFPGLVD